ncbi:cytochrome c550 [Salinibacillus xinjiangensis]|uniref:C-type cytochrome n=1 Tax=Salinibacillus xinjiangensis TaxID=1229268 RepID=A0A6G1X735_9BACI|nr:cytochrome c [Salinibacillus xinjiangensis]MRG86618.1 c-type cytochrome [Salinibacillus xinjiangensis]
MKKNPVIPYAIIGVLGIVAMIILASVGANQMDEVRGEGEEGKASEEQSGGEAVMDAETLFQNNCSMCHGADLAGSGSAPALNKVGSKYSAKEIADIINNGKGSGMPGGLVQPEQATALSEWLAEKK